MCVPCAGVGGGVVCYGVEKPSRCIVPIRMRATSFSRFSVDI